MKLSAQLKLDVEEASIPSTRKKIERGLSDIEIGGSSISGQLSQDVQAGASGGSALGTSIQAEQLSVLENINDTLEKMAVSASRGGNGGGGVTDSALDIALTQQVLKGKGGSGALSKTLGAVGSASLLTSSVTAAGVGLPALALYGILSDDTADVNIPTTQSDRQDGTPNTTVTTPNRDAADQLDQRLSDIQVDAPEWLRDPELHTPSWLNGPIGVDVPSVLEDLRVSLPPALQDLLDSGGDSYRNPSRINPNQPREGGDVALQTRADNQTSNRSRDRFDINLNVEHELRNASREFERAIEESVRRSSALERLVQEELRKVFENNR
jgi:hypothetical protein